MNSQKRTTETHSRPQKAQLPVGGALIDGQGREIPITEGMIHLACQALENNSVGAARRA